MPGFRVAVLLIFASAAAGCTAPGATQQYQSRVITSGDAADVLDVAAVILEREFGEARIDRATREIRTPPVEFTTRRESGTARDLVRGESTLRRAAVLRIVDSGPQTIARLTVNVERLDTPRHVVAEDRTSRTSDTPGYTAIERDAATTDAQNQSWTFVRRDRALERKLLDEMANRFERTQPDAAPREREPAPGQAAEGQAGSPER